MTAALEGGEWSAAPRERLSTNFTGGWMDPRDRLDGRKMSSPPGFDPGLSSPQSVSVPTELPGPPKINNGSYKYKNVDSMFSRIPTYS